MNKGVENKWATLTDSTASTLPQGSRWWEMVVASQTLFTLVGSFDFSETFVIPPFDLAYSIRCLGAEAKAQLVKGLPYKHSDLHLIPRTCISILTIPVLGQWKQTYSWSAWLVSWSSGPVRACLREEKKSGRLCLRLDTWGCSLAFTRQNIPTWTYTHTQTGRGVHF